ncbi:hypothetical protein D3C71_1278800 [compost metagenome]
MQEEGIRRAEHQPAGLHGRLDPITMVEKPGQFGGGKIRAEREAAKRPHLVFDMRQLIDFCRGAAVLPDDDGRERSAVQPVPGKAAFALIGEADRRHRPGGRKGRAKIGDELFRIMFHAVATREMLTVAGRIDDLGLTLRIDLQGACRGRSLVEC